MNNTIRIAQGAGVALALALSSGLAPSPVTSALGIDSQALAQSSGREKRRRVPNITEATFRQLSDAQELVDAAQCQLDENGKPPPAIEGAEPCRAVSAAEAKVIWAEALAVLTRMEQRSRRYNGNERGQIHNLLAYVNYELDDIDKTIYHYEQVLAQVPDITEVVENTTLQQLSKLYFTEGQEYEGDEALPYYRKALAMMEQWLVRNDNPGPEPHFYMAQIYYQMKDFANAIARLELVVSIARERAMKVKESWWTMLQFLYFEEENWPKVIEILEILVKDYPKRVYWVNLASVYGETDQADKQLWTLEAAHAGGFLDQETDLRTFGGLLLQNEIPNRAGWYLQKGFDDEIIERTATNLQTLGQAYQVGEDVDKAIPVFEEAADRSDDGGTYDRLAMLYQQKDEFSKCVDAADKALDKGGLRKPVATKITKAICQFNLDRFTASRATFVEVRREARLDGMRQEERTAGQWVNYIDNERKRRAELERL